MPGILDLSEVNQVLQATHTLTTDGISISVRALPAALHNRAAVLGGGSAHSSHISTPSLALPPLLTGSPFSAVAAAAPAATKSYNTACLIVLL
jgi:hypothetical protein